MEVNLAKRNYDDTAHCGRNEFHREIIIGHISPHMDTQLVTANERLFPLFFLQSPIRRIRQEDLPVHIRKLVVDHQGATKQA